MTDRAITLETSPESSPQIVADTKVGDYLALLKPRVMSLVVFTGFAGLVLAPGSLDTVTALIAIIAIGVGAGASGAAAPAVDQSALLARRRLQIASDYSAWAERLDRAEASTASSQSNDWQPLRGIEAMRRSASTVAAVSGEAAQRTRFANSQEFVETMLPMAEKTRAPEAEEGTP